MAGVAFGRGPQDVALRPGLGAPRHKSEGRRCGSRASACGAALQPPPLAAAAFLSPLSLRTGLRCISGPGEFAVNPASPRGGRAPRCPRARGRAAAMADVSVDQSKLPGVKEGRPGGSRAPGSRAARGAGPPMNAASRPGLPGAAGGARLAARPCFAQWPLNGEITASPGWLGPGGGVQSGAFCFET